MQNLVEHHGVLRCVIERQFVHVAVANLAVLKPRLAEIYTGDRQHLV